MEAAPALDAVGLRDPSLGDIVQIEVLPVGEVRHRPAVEGGKVRVPLLVHPGLQPLDHLGHDPEAIGHRRRADLHIARAHGDELGGIAPGGHAADSRDRQALHLRIARHLPHHVERNRLDRRAAIPAVRALAVDHRLGAEGVEVDGRDGLHRVDQADRIRAARMGRNLATGEAIKIKASKKVAFRPSKELKEAI